MDSNVIACTKICFMLIFRCMYEMALKRADLLTMVSVDLIYTIGI